MEKYCGGFWGTGRNRYNTEFCNNKLKHVDFPIEFHNCADSIAYIDNMFYEIVDIH